MGARINHVCWYAAAPKNPEFIGWDFRARRTPDKQIKYGPLAQWLEQATLIARSSVQIR